MARTLTIGDIHGGLKGLQQVLKRAKITEDDHLIFLGDYVDGWGESAQTVDFLISLSRKHNCTFLRGNHDDLVFHWLLGRDMAESWYIHGGKATLKSYAEYSEEQKKEHLKFYRSLKDYYLDDQNRLFAHAGFQNRNGVELEYHNTAFYWDRTLWEMCAAMDESITPDDPRYPQRLSHYNEIYIGHTPVTLLGYSTPVNRANVWNVDTGAAFKGPITILDIDTKEVWQSDPVFEHYPDEEGRNKS
ncbi:MAG: metallophosphoesterase family protein [Leeuwenhoekiella sp.]